MINIFSVASGHLYERLLRIMMLSLLKHTKVKFIQVTRLRFSIKLKHLPVAGQILVLEKLSVATIHRLPATHG